MRVSIAGIALGIIQAFGQEANSCDMNSATMSGDVIGPLTGSQRPAKPNNAAPEGISGRAVHRYRSLDWQHAFNLAPKGEAPFLILLNRGNWFMTQ